MIYLKSLNWIAALITGMWQSWLYLGHPEFWLWWCLVYYAGEKLATLWCLYED